MSSENNPFSNINFSSLKTLFNNAMDTLLASTACTMSCTLQYAATKYEECVNCVYDPIGKKSSNRFRDGGPAPFRNGTICPMCNGEGKKEIVSTENNLSLMVIFDSKNFINAGTVDTPANTIQTVSDVSTTSKLRRAAAITVDADVSGHFTHRYTRTSEPTPCGFGNGKLVTCTWIRND